jgi:hypothetical protein
VQLKLWGGGGIVPPHPKKSTFSEISCTNISKKCSWLQILSNVVLKSHLMYSNANIWL